MKGTDAAEPADGLEVGDDVVVESAKATFFEGTIVSRRRDAVRVQPKPSGDAAERPVADVYRLGSPARRLEVGAHAICRAGMAKWRGCRVERVEGGKYIARDAEGAELQVSPDEVLAPTPVTDLNVSQALERGAKRRTFREEAERAGGPRAPSGFRPRSGELVLARRDGIWVGARVKELRKTTVMLLWDGDKQPIEVSREELVPQPPVAYSPLTGAFVLVRPPTGLRAWTVGRVESVTTSAVVVSDEVGERRSVLPRDVLPLER